METTKTVTISEEQVEIVETSKFSIDDLENEFNNIVAEADKANQVVNDTIKIDELNEIGEEIIKAKKYLAEYAATGSEKSAKEMAYGHLTSVPLIGKWAQNKIEEVHETNLKNSGVKEILEDIFNSFEIKKKRLIELTNVSESMRNNLIEQREKMTVYITKLDDVVENPASMSDKMRAIDISNQAMQQREIMTDMVENQLTIILSMMETLHSKLSKTLPVIKNTLSNSLNVAATINSMRDTITMMNTLEELSNDIQSSSSKNIQNLIIESTKTLSSGTDIEYYKNTAKRNEQYQNTLLEARKEYVTKTVEKYGQLKEIQIDSSNMLERRVKEEALLLEESLAKMSETK